MTLEMVLITSLLAAPAEKPKNLAGSVKALCTHLGVGKGSRIADVGAGRGEVSWLFARVVGEEGKVYAEEIDKRKVDRLKKEAAKRKLKNVEAVLGTIEDPCLPEKRLDMIFLRRVYHHLGKPRPMLRHMWKALKPGGFFVVVDQWRGTLRDWVPRETRTKRHHWIAETTVVREAREEGFEYVECAEDFWHEKIPFVLVFRRPVDLKEPGRDPDPFLPLDGEKTADLLLPFRPPDALSVFIALGEGRKLLPPLVRAAKGGALEIVLEEWATQKDERPPLPFGLSFPSVLTENGDPKLGKKRVSVVYFLDSYHILFHGKALLAALRRSLAVNGIVYILDREAPKPLSRREASHRRAIRPEAVIKEMEEAGFSLWRRGPRPAPDRFLLCFGKVPSGELWRELDPLVAGPVIPEKPGPWLRRNLWRLRGLRTADGRRVFFHEPGDKPGIECKTFSGDDIECKVSAGKVTLFFRKKGDAYTLRRSVTGKREHAFRSVRPGARGGGRF